MVSKKEQKIINIIKKNAEITETGFKKNLQNNKLRISNENSKKLIIVMAKGRTNFTVMHFLNEQNKFIEFMKHVGRTTVQTKDIKVFQSLRYL